jgi:hypothetical protein
MINVELKKVKAMILGRIRLTAMIEQSKRLTNLELFTLSTWCAWRCYASSHSCFELNVNAVFRIEVAAYVRVPQTPQTSQTETIKEDSVRVV